MISLKTFILWHNVRMQSTIRALAKNSTCHTHIGQKCCNYKDFKSSTTTTTILAIFKGYASFLLYRAFYELIIVHLNLNPKAFRTLTLFEVFRKSKDSWKHSEFWLSISHLPGCRMEMKAKINLKAYLLGCNNKIYKI